MATIVDYLNSKGVVLRTGFPEVWIRCPSCGSTKNKCSINVQLGIGHCFRATCAANKGFNFVGYISRVEGCSISNAIEIAKRYKDGIENFSYHTHPLEYSYPKWAKPIEELLHLINSGKFSQHVELLEHAVKYLSKKRGLTEQQIIDFQIGIGLEGFTVEDRFFDLYGHIVIPVIFHEEVVSYATRTIEINGIRVSKTKFHNATTEEGYHTISEVLFNFENAIRAARKRGIFVLFEDAWSSIKMEGAGLLGANLSQEQIAWIKTNWKGPIVICLDNDAGGIEGAQKIQKALLSAGFEDVRIVLPPVGIDPDDDVVTTLKAILTSEPSDPFLNQLTHSLSKR